MLSEIEKREMLIVYSEKLHSKAVNNAVEISCF